MAANVTYNVEQRRLLRNSRYPLAGSDSLSTCSSNRQPELKVAHANTPTAPPHFKNVIFRHHYVMKKNSRCIGTEQRYPLQNSLLHPPKCNVDKPT